MIKILLLFMMVSVTSLVGEDVPPDIGYTPISMPSVDIPSVVLPEASATTIVTPQVNKVSLIPVTLFDNSSVDPAVRTLLPTTATINVTNYDEVAKGLIDINTGVENQSSFINATHPKNFIGDKRAVFHAQNKVADNPLWAKWKSVYTKTYPPIQYIPATGISQIKMIAEMRAVETTAARDNLIKELKYFKTLGYNSVLAVWEGNNLSTLIEQIDVVKGLGFKVYFTFGTRENLSNDIFIDVDLYQQGLVSLASSCDGYLIGWRRTSAHLFKADKQWIDFSLDCVRKGNPNILVFGEIYRGSTGKFNKGKEITDELVFTVPANSSGAFVINLGFQGVRPEGVLKLVRTSCSVPLVIVIVGEQPYYMSINKNNKTKRENREIIKRIEDRFRKFNFGTATLVGDGSNEVYINNISDDLCKSQWSN